VTFDLCMGHDHSSHLTEGEGHRSRLGLELASQFKARSVGPRSSIEDSCPVVPAVTSQRQITEDHNRTPQK